MAGRLLVDIDELLTGLLLARAHDLPAHIPHSQVGLLANLDHLLAYLLCLLPLFQQMVALHYKQRIKYNPGEKSINISCHFPVFS
jgi:hypothetical protein